MKNLANFVAVVFLGILLFGASLAKQITKPANATPPGFPPAPAKETADVGPPPDLSLGTTKCKCSGDDCKCEPLCLCVKGNECKSAYRAIVKTCEAAQKGNCDCFEDGGCKCEGDKQCSKPAASSPFACGICKGTGKCQTCLGTGREPFKAEEPKYTEPAKPAPAKAAAPAMVLVNEPYEVRSGLFGGRTRTYYRQAWITQEEYARRMAAQKQRTFYRGGGCANGSCR